MNQLPPSRVLIAFYVFCTILAITVLVYLLRGFGLLGFIPGAVIWVLILLSIATGIISGVQRTRGRYWLQDSEFKNKHILISNLSCWKSWWQQFQIGKVFALFQQSANFLKLMIFPFWHEETGISAPFGVANLASRVSNS